MLERRHGTEVHAHKALAALAIWLLGLVLYSVVCLTFGAIRSRSAPGRKFTYPSVPVWLIILWFASGTIYGFVAHQPHSQIQFARRSGRLALSAAILAIFISAKPAYLPRTYAVPLVAVHKWVGRAAALFAFIHAVLFLYAYISRGSEMEHRLLSTRIFLGVLSALCMVIVVVSSLKTIRRRAYWVFYGIHVPAVWFMLVAMIWHAHPAVNWLLGGGMGMLGLQMVLRIISTRTLAPTEVRWFGSRLALVVLPALPGNTPGSYVRMGRPLQNPLAWITSTHPFTVASVPDDPNVLLVVRKTRFTISTNTPLGVRGPFTTPFDPAAYSKIVVVAGGSGIAIAGPLCRAHPRVKLVWATRTPSEIPILGHLGINSAAVYITSGPEAVMPGPEPADTDIEMDTLLPEGQENVDAEVKPDIRTFRGRPLLTNAVGDFLQQEDGSDVCVVACGPVALIEDAREWARYHSHAFYAEAFEL